MTEKEWFTSAQLFHMFYHAKTERKKRLIAVACGNLIRDLFKDERSRYAIDVAEQYADNGDYNSLSNAYAISQALNDDASEAATNVCNPRIDYFSFNYITTAYQRNLFINVSIFKWFFSSDQIVTDQRKVIVDIIPNPFIRILIDGKPELESDFNYQTCWATKDVKEVAKRIYDEKRFDELSILADALEDSGCNDSRILNHFRDRNKHYRGCWALDLILGKS